MRLVKILSDDNGEIRDLNKQYWHLVSPINLRGSATFCQDEFFGYGESRCKYEEKTVKRGGITCPECISKIKAVKRIKL